MSVMNNIKTGLTVLALITASALAHAEHTAPVYDIDSLSQDAQLEGNAAPDNSAKTALNQALSDSTEPPASLEQRVARLEQQLANARQSDLANHLNSMQGEVQALRGQVEELIHQLQELHNQQRGQHAEAEQTQTMSHLPRVADEDSANAIKPVYAKTAEGPKSSTVQESENHLRKPSENLTGPLASNAHSVRKTVLSDKKSTEPEQPDAAEEQGVYQVAYNLIKVKKYNEAIASLQKILLKYPSGQFAANAHYWLGELYSLTGEHERAASEFNVVVQQYPTHPRVADAELKLGLINASLLKWPAAKASFKKVLTQYPGTTSARLAREQLRQLKQAGH